MYIIDTILSEIIEFMIFFILYFFYIHLAKLILIMIILIVTLSFSILAGTKIHLLFFDMIYSLLPNRSKETMTFYDRFREYIINNKKLFIATLIISLISGFVLLFFILPTYSSYYIRVFFLSILLIAAILSYMLLFNLVNIIKILSKLSEDAIDMIILWSSILLLSFSKVEESIANIFVLHSTTYSLVAYIIIVITIFFLMFIMSLYVYAVNINKSIENNINKNTEKLTKWTVVTGFSISLLDIYLFGNRSILYIIMGILNLIILIAIYPYVHSCILNNINKKNWNDILGIILAVYIISFTILYPVIGGLYLAMIYVFLTIIPLFFYCLLKINKEKDYNKQ